MAYNAPPRDCPRGPFKGFDSRSLTAHGVVLAVREPLSLQRMARRSNRSASLNGVLGSCRWRSFWSQHSSNEPGKIILLKQLQGLTAQHDNHRRPAYLLKQR